MVEKIIVHKMQDFWTENHYVRLRFTAAIIAWILSFVILSLLVVRIHWCADNPEVKESTWWIYVWNFVLNNAPLVGVLSGFFGIFIGFLCLGARFSIAPDLVWTNTNRLQISVRNDFYLISLSDITIEVDFIREKRGGKDVQTRKIEMNKDSVTLLRGRLYGSAKCYYTFHSMQGFVWNENYTKIRCRVTAVHGISSIIRIKEQIFVHDQLKRGKFIDGAFVPQINLYPTKEHTYWDFEVGRMCGTLQRINESVLYTIEPIGMSKGAEMLNKIDKAIEQVRSLQMKKMHEKFPSLLNNEDTIVTLLGLLAKLHCFYELTKNLNPEHKRVRNAYTDEICKYIVFIGDQMNLDIQNKYNELIK